MPKDDLKIIGFAAAVCVVCSLLLSATASALRDRQERNVELDRKLNVLKAFGLAVEDEKGKTIPEEVVDRYFTDHIDEVMIDKASGQVLEGKTSADIPKDERKAKTIAEKTMLPLYTWSEDGKVAKYAFPVSGPGLWSVVYGYLALDHDLATIVGVTFYKHGETPGLGGECSEDWFQDGFKTKKVWADGDLLDFEVVKGTVEGQYPDGNDHAVDGISGATMTGNGIEAFLREDLKHYNRYFKTVRGS
jgi:Na+-transporting NADH:ubiquinone oxidoreductase subunit C